MKRIVEVPLPEHDEMHCLMAPADSEILGIQFVGDVPTLFMLKAFDNCTDREYLVYAICGEWTYELQAKDYLGSLQFTHGELAGKIVHYFRG